MSQTVAASDDECLERQSRIKRRTAQRFMHAGDRTARKAQLRAVAPAVERLRLCRLRRLALQWGDTDGGTDDELDACAGAIFRLPASQHPLGIMRLNPAF